jgi:hypothetical protein
MRKKYCLIFIMMTMPLVIFAKAGIDIYVENKSDLPVTFVQKNSNLSVTDIQKEVGPYDTVKECVQIK